MNAVEIEAAISDLALQPFDAAEFPFAFLAAFGNKDTALKRLRTGNSNLSDIPGAFLQRNNIHIAACDLGTVAGTLKLLRESASTSKAKAKFILATDGRTLEAEELTSGDTVEINRRRGESHRGSDIPLTNFRGVELRDFPAEIARLALIIAEFQCDVLYRGQKDALAEFLPLDTQNWIVCGNALRLDWSRICPPKGTGVKLVADDLFGTPLDQAEIDFENEGGENYICGNPPYKGSQDQTTEQKKDLEVAFAGRIKSTKSADYVSGWFILARDYVVETKAKAAFVTTNSINQGRQVSLLWPAILSNGIEIAFARPSFSWSNLASKKAVVTVSIVGLAVTSNGPKCVYDGDTVKVASYIGPYLVPDQPVIVFPSNKPLSGINEMTNGSMPNDGGGLILTPEDAQELVRHHPEVSRLVKKFIGSEDCIHGKHRYCLWIAESDLDVALDCHPIRLRVEAVKKHRLSSSPIKSTLEKVLRSTC